MTYVVIPTRRCEPMAPCTRAAKARAAAAAEAACHLLDLSHDEQSIVTHELCSSWLRSRSRHVASAAAAEAALVRGAIMYLKLWPLVFSPLPLQAWS